LSPLGELRAGGKVGNEGWARRGGHKKNLFADGSAEQIHIPTDQWDTAEQDRGGLTRQEQAQQKSHRLQEAND
jgi:hypothetical protein